MSAVHDGRCSPWVMCSRVSGNQIHDTYVLLLLLLLLLIGGSVIN